MNLLTTCRTSPVHRAEAKTARTTAAYFPLEADSGPRESASDNERRNTMKTKTRWTSRAQNAIDAPFTGVLHWTGGDGCTPKHNGNRIPATPREQQTGRPCLRCTARLERA